MISDSLSTLIVIHHYVEPQHSKDLIETIWDIGTAVYEHHIVFLEYQKANGEITTALIKPVGSMCSKYYFYLNAYIGEKDKKYNGYPTVYRVDRIKSYKVADDTFYVPYKGRFEEGEFRTRIPFMYTGKLHTARFIYKGRDINQCGIRSLSHSKSRTSEGRNTEGIS